MLRAGGHNFPELDLSHAYEQIKLDDQSQAIWTIKTHKGLFKYKRLSYGVSSEPVFF